MANHLIENSDDPKFKRWVISSIVARTYYHNFVTHLLEAAYQRKVYERIDAGGSVNAGVLNNLKRGVLEEFWGDDVEINEGAELDMDASATLLHGLVSIHIQCRTNNFHTSIKRILKKDNLL